jgi:mycothiol synthase
MHREYTSRPYAGEADLAPLCDLINANYALDWPDHSMSVDDVRRLLIEAPGVNPGLDVRLWDDDQGMLAGAGQLCGHPRGVAVNKMEFDWFVHPTGRGRGLEASIHAWGLARLAEITKDQGQPAHLECRAGAGAAYRHAVLDVQGYRAVRYGFTMTRSLADPLADAILPPGYTLQAASGAADLAAWVALHNAAFVDHWGFRPWTVAEQRYWLSAPQYRADGDLRAVAPDGSLAAYCLCWIDPAANRRHGRNDGWIALLGTHPAHRRRGLGQALLRAGLHWLRDAGIATAVLAVDVENATGALRLYESCGFVQVDGQVIYHHDI